MTISKVAIAQITLDPGTLDSNTEKIKRTASEAEQRGADLVVFPELSIPGYAHMDLCYLRSFLDATEKALENLISQLPKIPVLLGSIHYDSEQKALGDRPFLYNSAYLIADNQLVFRKDKTLLPTYDVFSERRYFQSATEADVVEISGTRLAVSICEDLWDAEKRVSQLQHFKEQGAELLISLNASPFSVGKRERRLEVFSPVATELNTPLVYCNLVGGFDCYDSEVVFDGHSFALSAEGKPTALAKGFSEELLLADVTTAKELPSLPELSDEEQLFEAATLGAEEYFRRHGFSHAYIGISGGIDSAVVAAIMCKAIGAENVTGVTLPSHVTSDETKSDAFILAQRLGFKLHEVSIKEEFEAWLKVYKDSGLGEPTGLERQNKQSRIRGANLMSLSNGHPGSLVISTGNKTELATGYCTLYGDMNGAFAPLGDMNKQRVYAVARYCNKTAGAELIPQSIIDREPSAELEHDQKDSDNLPADYDVLSPLVNEIIETDFSIDDLLSRYPEEAVFDTLKLIHHNEYKRRQASPSIRMTERSFGIERRIPMGNQFLLFKPKA